MMKYIELSIKDLEKQSIKLAKKVSEEFQPDVIVFIAKGSFLIGYELSKFFNIPLVECFAVRKGNTFKEILRPVFKVIPKSFKKYLREKEIKSGVHKKESARNVFVDKGKDVLNNPKKVLIVDDSVDSGNTAREVYYFLQNNYQNKELRFAALNYFDESKSVFKVDYSLTENTIMSGPWSKDSKEYAEFVKRYNNWRKK